MAAHLEISPGTQVEKQWLYDCKNGQKKYFIKLKGLNQT